MDILNDRAFAAVSALISAGDGLGIDTITFQPPLSAASNLMHSTAELWRRAFTHILSPSASVVSGTGVAAVALTFGATPLGLFGMCQGQPFLISGTGLLSGTVGSAASTASNQIRKVLVTFAFPAFGGSGPATSSLASTAVTALQFVYGSAMVTSANAANSGGQGASYFDMVPLPLASANEVPVGWLNIPNSYGSGGGVAASYMFSDYRVFQGYNLSAIFATRVQP
jgi:hypothetical protein